MTTTKTPLVTISDLRMIQSVAESSNDYDTLAAVIDCQTAGGFDEAHDATKRIVLKAFHYIKGES